MCVCARVCDVHGEVRQCVVGAVWYGDASSVWTIYNAGERGRLLSAAGRRRGGGAGMPLRPSGFTAERHRQAQGLASWADASDD